jgi:hypothetical protein
MDARACATYADGNRMVSLQIVLDMVCPQV